MSSDPLRTVPPSAARVIVTVGFHGSASTWAFNVARELMIAALGADLQPIIAAAHTAHNLIHINVRSPDGCFGISVR